MNLLYVIPAFGPTVLGNLIHREIGHEFQKKGHSFSVFALAAARELNGHSTDSIEENIPVHRAVTAGRWGEELVNRLTRPIFKYERFVTGVLHLMRYLARHPEVELVLAEGAFPCGAMAALARPRRLVITMAGGDFISSRETNYGYGRYRICRALMRLAFRRAAAVRITTPLIQSYALALGARQEQIALIPRNIASYCFPPADRPLATFRADAREKLCARYQLDQAQVIIGVGRLLPIKGFELLLRALPLILDAIGDTRVLLVGPNRVDSQFGDYQQHLKKLASDLHVNEKVVFTGAIAHQEMPEYLAGADVIAVPSILEGMNKIVVEGAAVGTPSVVTATAGIADLVQDTGVGHVIYERSPEILANALIHLLKDPSQRATACQQGPDFARRFSSERIGAELVKLCERAAAHP